MGYGVTSSYCSVGGSWFGFCGFVFCPYDPNDANLPTTEIKLVAGSEKTENSSELVVLQFLELRIEGGYRVYILDSEESLKI